MQGECSGTGAAPHTRLEHQGWFLNVAEVHPVLGCGFALVYCRHGPANCRVFGVQQALCCHRREENVMEGWGEASRVCVYVCTHTCTRVHVHVCTDERGCWCELCRAGRKLGDFFFIAVFIWQEERVARQRVMVAGICHLGPGVSGTLFHLLRRITYVDWHGNASDYR